MFESQDKSMKRKLAIILIITLVAFLSYGCKAKPTLINLNPTSGPPGTIVEVEGTSLFLAEVRWDANSPNEISLPTNFLSATTFSVPLNASQGPHPVRLFGDGQYSNNIINIDVTDEVIRPRPRVGDITVSFFSIDGGKATLILMVHGANIDVGAEILIDGVAVPTGFSKALRNTALNANDPATLGYPVFHYATIWTFLSDQTPGSTINVGIENLDGSTSDSLSYTIANSEAELDSDGDGLLDEWEKNGYDADGDGTIDIDLPALGADPYRKDLFIEVDWMSTFVPNNGIWANIETIFADAPILNPDGSEGIQIHIDRGQAGAGGGGGDVIAATDRIRYDNFAPTSGFTYSNFYTLKNNNFAADRLNIFRYCIFADDSGHTPGSSGRAEGFIANDFFVSLGGWGNAGLGVDIQVSTFVHELGHTLGLHHGGEIDDNYKPNYNSIMTYGGGADWNASFGRCIARFDTPSQVSGKDTDCNLNGTDNTYSYSQGMRAALDETSLNEALGVCDNIPIDWDNDGNSTENSVARDINCDGYQLILEDYPDWDNIQINFLAPGSEWGGN